MNRSSYAAKLRDPRWQKRRLEIMQRDRFRCQSCGDESTTLHVHHKYYEWGADPWDYPLDALVTLCETCHEEETVAQEEKREAMKRLKRVIAVRDVCAVEVAALVEMVDRAGIDILDLAYTFNCARLPQDRLDDFQHGLHIVMTSDDLVEWVCSLGKKDRERVESERANDVEGGEEW